MLHGFGDGCDVFGRVATAATCKIEQPRVRKVGQPAVHVIGCHVKACWRQGVGQTSIRIAGNVRGSAVRKLLEKRLHEVGPERAIQSNRERINVGDSIP